MDKELSLFELYYYFKKWFWIIVGTALIGAGFFIIAGEQFGVADYRSEAELIVNQNQVEDVIQYNEVQTNVQMINTYRQIILGRSFLQRVSSDLEVPFTVDVLRDSLIVQQVEKSQTFNIIAELESPLLAQSVIEGVIKEFEEMLGEIYGTDIIKVVVLSDPSYEPQKLSTSMLYRTVLGGIVGTLLSIGLLSLNVLLDTKVKDEILLRQLDLVKLGEMDGLTTQNNTEAYLNSD